MGICWICENRSNLLKIGLICDLRLKQIFLSPDLWSTTRYKSMDSRGQSSGTQYPDTIPATLIFHLWLRT